MPTNKEEREMKSKINLKLKKIKKRDTSDMNFNMFEFCFFSEERKTQNILVYK